MNRFGKGSGGGSGPRGSGGRGTGRGAGPGGRSAGRGPRGGAGSGGGPRDERRTGHGTGRRGTPDGSGAGRPGPRSGRPGPGAGPRGTGRAPDRGQDRGRDEGTGRGAGPGAGPGAGQGLRGGQGSGRGQGFDRARQAGHRTGPDRGRSSGAAGGPADAPGGSNTRGRSGRPDRGARPGDSRPRTGDRSARPAPENRRSPGNGSGARGASGRPAPSRSPSTGSNSGFDGPGGARKGNNRSTTGRAGSPAGPRRGPARPATGPRRAPVARNRDGHPGVGTRAGSFRETRPKDRGPAVDVHDPDGVRLQKVLAQAGLGSRRACEDLISSGRVEIDGHVVTELGVRIDPRRSVVHVDGMRIQVDSSLVHLAVNKPRGVVSTMSDPQGRPCLGDLVSDREARLFHVGRLDVDTEGLILVTNDGELANRLAHPRYGVLKTYLAEIEGSPPRDLGARLRSGIELDDGPVRVDGFSVVDARPGKALVEVTLHEGRKHVVRRLLDAVGFPVVQLVRTDFGPIRLGTLRPGTSRVLNRAELAGLLEHVGL